MGRYLIVANQTLGGDRLAGAVRDRIERGDSRFYILVPMVAPHYEAAAWIGDPDFPMAEGMANRQSKEEHEAMLGEARERAQRRLDQMIDKIRSAGGDVDGDVGDADPIVAVRTALRDQSFDEIIVSTLPAGISRWLKMDLPSRVSRMTEMPVITIEADD